MCLYYLPPNRILIVGLLWLYPAFWFTCHLSTMCPLTRWTQTIQRHRHAETPKAVKKNKKQFSAVSWSYVVGTLYLASPSGRYRAPACIGSGGTDLSMSCYWSVPHAVVRSFDVGEKKYLTVEISVSESPITNASNTSLLRWLLRLNRTHSGNNR